MRLFTTKQLYSYTIYEAHYPVTVLLVLANDVNEAVELMRKQKLNVMIFEDNVKQHNTNKVVEVTADYAGLAAVIHIN